MVILKIRTETGQLHPAWDNLVAEARREIDTNNPNDVYYFTLRTVIPAKLKSFDGCWEERNLHVTFPNLERLTHFVLVYG